MKGIEESYKEYISYCHEIHCQVSNLLMKDLKC